MNPIKSVFSRTPLPTILVLAVAAAVLVQLKHRYLAVRVAWQILDLLLLLLLGGMLLGSVLAERGRRRQSTSALPAQHELKNPAAVFRFPLFGAIGFGPMFLAMWTVVRVGATGMEFWLTLAVGGVLTVLALSTLVHWIRRKALGSATVLKVKGGDEKHTGARAKV